MNGTEQKNSTSGAESANGAERLHPHIPQAPAFDAKTVMKRALDAATGRASDLFDGLKALDVMGEAERVELKGETLKWLAAKFMEDADEIMTDLDYADHAHRGGVYDGAAERYRDRAAEFAAIDAELRMPGANGRSEHGGGRA